ncbi:MAG: arginase family protein [Candidatus Thermoplasmatota archaeon]|nr:arginase family protein [Candidatus Thermoplasmatota archaeon]MEC8311569.1 arginase family protein [Candidatus Thermoplasmatota archaeon]
MDDGAPTFLGLPEDGKAAPDVVILPLPYELTTSYGQGTAKGPVACLEASAQVEVYEVMLGEDLPAGLAFRTEKPWTSDAGSLLEQLDDMEAFLRPWCSGDVFPMALGGEHGILPPLLAALRDHPALDGDLGRLTVVQIDAHADLRSQLDGEPFSHASAAARALDLGVGRLLQVGVRAHSLEEQQRIDDDARITTWFARDVMAPRGGETNWASFIEVLKGLEGPVHLTFDIDGLDGTLVPATGTPVPGGLSFWHAVQAIEAVFSAPKATVISADVNEIARQDGTPLTQFTAAMVATKIVGAHVSARRAGRWEKAADGRGGDRAPMHRHTFTQGTPN